MIPSPLRGRFRRALRLIGWNVLLTVVGVALTALVGEAYFRLTVPFWESRHYYRKFVPNVGILRLPNTEIAYTNRFDYWTVSRTNSLGFLDREPPSPERAAASCHVSIIGDSFVDAIEVPIEDKLQVRLEELAASRLPHLDIATSAFGFEGTGQVQQLPFYDEYARRLHPKLLVLVFVDNDFVNNTPILRSVTMRNNRLSEPVAGRRLDGKLELTFGHPRFPVPSIPPRPLGSWAVRTAGKVTHKVVHHSWFAFWLYWKTDLFHSPDPSLSPVDVYKVFARRDLPPLFEEALEYTAFALEQFKQRADLDGAKLVILASYTLKVQGTLMFERMSEMAAALGIPVIDQAGYILRQGADLSDARSPHNYHWNPAGHQWAAEALLEYIEENQEICDG